MHISPFVTLKKRTTADQQNERHNHEIISHPSSFKEPTPPLSDRFDVVPPGSEDFTKGANGRKVVLALRAPVRLWIQQFDWVNGPFPSDISINLRARIKGRTGIIQRIEYHRKQQKARCKSTNRKKLLLETLTIPVFEGELSNEEVKI